MERQPGIVPEVTESQAEVLPSQERERLKAEVLKELESSNRHEQPPIAPPARPKPLPTADKNPTTVAIEQVLEADLSAIYFRLEPAVQQRLKQRGEQTAREIETILDDTKQRVERKMKNIFKLIIDWLRLLPGVNLFFIRQEAKIKTEKIMEIHRE